MPKEEGNLVLKILTPKGNFNRAVRDLLAEGYKYLSLAPINGVEIVDKRENYQIGKLPDGTIGLIYEGNHFMYVYSTQLPKVQDSGCGGNCKCKKD